MDFLEDEFIKYKSKKKKKGKKRSNHKHEYKECLVLHSFKNPIYGNMEVRFHPAKKCEICGYVRDEVWFPVIPEGNGLSRLMGNQEVFNAYSNCKIYDEKGKEIPRNEINFIEKRKK